MDTLVVGDLLRAQAKAQPDKPFLSCGARRYTYAGMDAVSDRVAAGLAELGVAYGDRLALVSTNRPELLELLFGCAKLGVIQVPLNAFLRGEFLRYQLADCTASTLVVDREGLASALPLLPELPGLKRLILLDDEPDDDLPVETLAYSKLRDAQGQLPSVSVSASDLMSILYTSGTTGMPKGCMMPHGYYVTIGSLMQDVWGVGADDTVFTALPLFHGAARAMVTMAALVHGATAVIEPSFSASGLLERLIDTQATVLFGVGAMGAAMLSLPSSDDDRAHQLRFAGFIPFSTELQQQFMDRFGVECHAEAFGQTECVPITYSRPDGPRNRASAGRPAAHLDVRLVDDNDYEVPVGEIGEIVARPRTPSAMYVGYWNKPADTVKAWRNLWHHTGDYGRADAGGFISFVDRKKDALRRRGENISSMELEVAILRHPNIAEAAVHAVPSGLLEDDVKACVVLTPDAEVQPAELFTFFQQNLPYYAVPRYVDILPELPKNAVARVMKNVLRERGNNEHTWDFDALGLVVAREARR